MILSVGEILVDMIGSADNTFQMFVGGAPFNVAVNAKQSGAKVGFVGRVGDDVAGRFIKQNIALYNLDYATLQQDNVRNTTLAFVALDRFGERDFTFFRHDTADFNLEMDATLLDSCPDLSIVHLGSLMLSEPKGVAFARAMADKVKQKKLVLSFDVNFRYDLYRTKKEAFAAYKEFIKVADILKFSIDEILDYTEQESLDKAIDAVDHKGLLLITLGDNGSMFCWNGIRQAVETVKVNAVDTTGAGDAFHGAILAQIDKIGYPNLNKENLTQALKFANKKGANATLYKGAVRIEG